MTTDYTEVFRDADAVEKYENVTYAPASYATRISERQQTYLRRLVRREFAGEVAAQHDFACGTGRAIRTLHGLVRTAHGYDTSAEMMRKAAQVGTRAHFHLVPTAGPVPEPVAAGTPAIVTMFRLLLNVDEGVRDRAIAFAAKVLRSREDGVLVIENHGNAASLRHLRAGRHSGERWFAELAHAQVGELLARHGFEVVDRRGFSMLTPSLHGNRLARAFDATTRLLPRADSFAVNVLYTARRAK